MEADFELGEGGEVLASGHGGRRAGAGRPTGYSLKKMQDMRARMEAGESLDDLDPESIDGKIATAVKTSIAKARKEAALADLKELQFKVESGKYLPRAAYRDATATLLANLSQGLRSLPDILERKYSLPPEALEVIQMTIDESLDAVADGLALFSGDDE